MKSTLSVQKFKLGLCCKDAQTFSAEVVEEGTRYSIVEGEGSHRHDLEKVIHLKTLEGPVLVKRPREGRAFQEEGTEYI